MTNLNLETRIAVLETKTETLTDIALDIKNNNKDISERLIRIETILLEKEKVNSRIWKIFTYFLTLLTGAGAIKLYDWLF